MIPDIHDTQEVQDLDLQHEVTQSILAAEEKGTLVGAEAPVYRCHTFIPQKSGDTFARILTRQINHLAKGLGVLGFQILYKEDVLEERANSPDSGYFLVRVFAENSPPEDIPEPVN